MRKVILSCTALTLAMGVVGCDKTRETLGLKRVQADEFEVSDRQPLSVPPEYSLRPPLPNAPARGEVDTAEKAKAALMEKSSSDAAPSAGEDALLAKTSDRDTADSATDIRADLDKESKLEEAKDADKAPGEDLVFWKETKKQKAGKVIDAKAENVKYNGQEYGQPSQTAQTSDSAN